MVPLALAWLAIADFARFLTKFYALLNAVVERVCHSHHMQLLSGCPPLVYWAGSYAWDLLMHSCVCFLAMLIFVIYQDKATTATLQQVLHISTFEVGAASGSHGERALPAGAAARFSLPGPHTAHVE